MRQWIKFKLIERSKKKDGWHYPDIKRPVRVEAKQNGQEWMLLIEATNIDNVLLDVSPFLPSKVKDVDAKNEIVKLLNITDKDIDVDENLRVVNYERLQ